MKRIGPDPIKSGVSDATELVVAVPTALGICFLKRFLSEESSKTSVKSVAESEDTEAARLGAKMRFTRDFKSFIEKHCDSTDAVVQFVANLVVHTDLLCMHAESTKEDDSICLSKILIDTMAIQALAGKKKMVDLAFNYIEQQYYMSAAERESCAINNNVRMNPGKGCVQMDNVCEIGNLKFKTGEDLPIDIDDCVIRSIYLYGLVLGMGRRQWGMIWIGC